MNRQDREQKRLRRLIKARQQVGWTAPRSPASHADRRRVSARRRKAMAPSMLPVDRRARKQEKRAAYVNEPPCFNYSGFQAKPNARGKVVVTRAKPRRHRFGTLVPS